MREGRRGKERKKGEAGRRGGTRERGKEGGARRER